MRNLTINCESYRIPEDLREEARNKIEVEQAIMNDRNDKARIKNVKFAMGDIVFVASNPKSTGESTKLQS